MKKCDRESVHRWTETHAQTHNNFIICPMLYAIAMGQIITYQPRRAVCNTKYTSHFYEIYLSIIIAAHKRSTEAVLPGSRSRIISMAWR